ncbi:MAG: integrase arm-type DNA-binding domain-containing protein [Pseudomonadota bacterium]
MGALPSGRHADGGGLYLAVKETGARSWAFMWKRNGKRREAGLGAFPDVSLAQARRIADTYRIAIAEGRDPIAERRATQAPKTFVDVVECFLADNEHGWRNAKHRQQWRNTLATYGKPIANMPLDEIDTEAVLRCLKPIWREKPETASRVRGRIERVLAYATARGWRDRERINPATWKGHLSAILPKPAKLVRGHHAAMRFEEVPEFMAALRQRKGIAAKALEFTILTAARSGEVREMSWSEIDRDAAVWTVPAERMKAYRAHRVPLTDAALAVLDQTPFVDDNPLVFPGAKGKPMSDMTLAAVLKRMDVDATVHGFRSSFRDWVGDATAFPRELAEAALAHAVGDQTERAYRRSDALERRRDLMEAWASMCGSSNA